MRIAAIVLLAAAGALAQEVGYKRGMVHPDFQLPLLDGTLARLSDYRGHKLVIINFASW